MLELLAVLDSWEDMKLVEDSAVEVDLEGGYPGSAVVVDDLGKLADASAARRKLATGMEGHGTNGSVDSHCVEAGMRDVQEGAGVFDVAVAGMDTLVDILVGDILVVLLVVDTIRGVVDNEVGSWADIVVLHLVVAADIAADSSPRSRVPGAADSSDSWGAPGRRVLRLDWCHREDRGEEDMVEGKCLVVHCLVVDRLEEHLVGPAGVANWDVEGGRHCEAEKEVHLACSADPAVFQPKMHLQRSSIQSLKKFLHFNEGTIFAFSKCAQTCKNKNIMTWE